MNVIQKTLVKIAQFTGIPLGQKNWLSPRYEPPNISSFASVQTIQTAVRVAETGNPTQLFQLYRDFLLGDDHVSGEFDKRKLAVLGQPLSVLPLDKENPDDRITAAACLAAMKSCQNWSDGMNALLGSTAIWPVAMAENIFKSADGAKPIIDEKSGRAFKLQYLLKRLDPVNPMLFCFQHAYLVGGVGLGAYSPIQNAQLGNVDRAGGDASNWWAINLDDWEPFLRLWPIDDAGRVIYDASRASKLDPDRHIVHRGHLMTEFRDNWGGPGRQLLYWILLRGLGRDWFGRFMERYGSPFVVGKTDATDNQAVALLQQAFSLSTKLGGLVIDQGDEVQLEQAMVQGGAEGHETFHNVCNSSISRRIVGGDLSSTAKATGMGSGTADLQGNVREDIRQNDQKRLAETLEKQVFARFIKFNGLPGQIQTVWGGLSDEDAKTFADLLKTLSDSGWEPTDEALPTMQERLGISLQRKARVSPIAPIGNSADDSLERMSAAAARLPKSGDAVDTIAAKHAPNVGRALREQFAPALRVLQESKSPAEAEKNLKVLFADMRHGDLVKALEPALQECAAEGAEDAVKNK